MERYIKKIADKFRMNGCNTDKILSPAFPEANLYDEKSPKCNYPLREVIGCLSWAALICRIDIANPVNVLARASSREPTKAIVGCCKKVLKYLISTPTVGLVYSPENERLFNSTYAELRSGGGPAKDWNTFSDASFASDFKTMKSISGSICYYRSFPIIWKGARQTVLTDSTFASEYVAAADALKVEESVDFRGFFGDDPESDFWLDNQTALALAKTASGAKRPKSRHVALRYMRASEAKGRLHFCPTQHQKADVMTKSTVSQAVRDHVFHHNPEMQGGKKERELAEQDLELDAMFTTAGSTCCYGSVLQFLDDEYDAGYTSFFVAFT